eukprot:scaffold6786_cov384-Prasinococcus_capsulatus_cf.AAC.6
MGRHVQRAPHSGAGPATDDGPWQDFVRGAAMPDEPHMAQLAAIASGGRRWHRPAHCTGTGSRVAQFVQGDEATCLRATAAAGRTPLHARRVDVVDRAATLHVHGALVVDLEGRVQLEFRTRSRRKRVAQAVANASTGPNCYYSYLHRPLRTSICRFVTSLRERELHQGGPLLQATERACLQQKAPLHPDAARLRDRSARDGRVWECK